MLTWLKAIGHFFTSLFGKSGNIVQTVLHDVSSFTNLAAPIVAELAAIAKADPNQTGLIANIETWLATYQTDAAKIQGWVTSSQGLSTADVLRSAAQLALSALVPSGTAASLLNLAIELAYNVFKAQTAAKPAAA
jgi:hypothetical protein